MEKATIREVLNLYLNDLRPNIKNTKAKAAFEAQLMEGITYATNCINDPYYSIKRYHIFTIYEPKIRLIMSLNIIDKIVNHYFTKKVLMPKTEKYLDIRNVATRRGMGTTFAINKIKSYLNKLKSDNLYVLKLDIKKYFYNIDHDVLKSMLVDVLDSDEYIRLSNLLNSTNASYINNTIIKLNKDLPIYKYNKGLPIGNLSSQCLSIFYLNRLDHFIVHDLHLKYYIRYMDDFIIFSNSKSYLKKCMNIIIDKLKNEYLLDISPKKSFIINAQNGFNFLGYHFIIRNNKVIVEVRKETRDKIKIKLKSNKYKYLNGDITYNKFISSISNYLYSYKVSYIDIKNYYDKYIC